MGGEGREAHTLRTQRSEVRIDGSKEFVLHSEGVLYVCTMLLPLERSETKRRIDGIEEFVLINAGFGYVRTMDMFELLARGGKNLGIVIFREM